MRFQWSPSIMLPGRSFRRNWYNSEEITEAQITHERSPHLPATSETLTRILRRNLATRSHRGSTITSAQGSQGRLGWYDGDLTPRLAFNLHTYTGLFYWQRREHMVAHSRGSLAAK
jgi:hypothetical protein